LKEGALDSTVGRTRCGRTCGPVVRQTARWTNWVLNRVAFIGILWC